MIDDNIDDDIHTTGMSGLDQGAEIIEGAKAPIQERVVDLVIAVVIIVPVLEHRRDLDSRIA